MDQRDVQEERDRVCVCQTLNFDTVSLFGAGLMHASVRVCVHSIPFQPFQGTLKCCKRHPFHDVNKKMAQSQVYGYPQVVDLLFSKIRFADLSRFWFHWTTAKIMNPDRYWYQQFDSEAHQEDSYKVVLKVTTYHQEEGTQRWVESKNLPSRKMHIELSWKQECTINKKNAHKIELKARNYQQEEFTQSKVERQSRSRETLNFPPIDMLIFDGRRNFFHG